jgi:hypothetical protein
MLPKRAWLLLLSITNLCAGTACYFITRPGIVLFRWLRIENNQYYNPTEQLKFLAGYAGDFAWILSLYFMVVAISVTPNGAAKKWLIPLPFVTEICQYFHIIPGVFDWYDILLYGVILFLFSCFYPDQFINMKIIKRQFVPAVTAILFFLMVLACASSKPAYHAPKPLPCVTHKGLNYSPVLTRIELSGSYTMKDLNGAQRYAYDYVMDELKQLNPGKYQLADGVTPNLTLQIVINTDSYQHYGATLNMYVYDGSAYYPWPSDYVTIDKLYDDICAKVNVFVSNGWCSNCPSPCNP